MPDWYDPSKIKSYNKTLNIITGGRGIGKTYGIKKDAINHYIKTGKQFFYVRRNIGDMRQAGTFLDDIIANNVFKDSKLTVKGGKKFATFFIDNKVMGYAMPLVTAVNFKSSSFPDVDTIIYDEFIPEKGGFNRYIPNEVEVFLGFIDSILRQRDGKIYLLANTQSKANPYFAYFDISPIDGQEFTTFKGSESKSQIIIQTCQDKYTKGKEEKTGFQNLISGTRYGDYNEGQYAYDSDDFIREKPKDASYSMTLYIDGIYYAVYICRNDGILFVSSKADKDYRFKYSIGKDRKENMVLAKTWRKDPRLNLLIRSFRDGSLFYENSSIKSICNDYLSQY